MYFAALLPELLRKNPVSFFFIHPVVGEGLPLNIIKIAQPVVSMRMNDMNEYI